MVLGHVQLYREQERGGGGQNFEDRKTQYFANLKGYQWGPISWWGDYVFYRDPHPTPTSKY